MIKTETVMDRLKKIPDPRKRQGRQYPFFGLLAILLLAAMHGERSLRGMWLWARGRERYLTDYLQESRKLRQWLFHPALGLDAVRRILSLGTFGYALSKRYSTDYLKESRKLMKGGELEEAWRVLLPEEREWAAEAKRLRGSKRVGEAEAWPVLSIAGTTLRQVGEQPQVAGGDDMEAAMAILEEFPLANKIISADAGILKAPFVQKVVEKGGDISV